MHGLAGVVSSISVSSFLASRDSTCGLQLGDLSKGELLLFDVHSPPWPMGPI